MSVNVAWDPDMEADAAGYRDRGLVVLRPDLGWHRQIALAAQITREWDLPVGEAYAAVERARLEAAAADFFQGEGTEAVSLADDLLAEDTDVDVRPRTRELQPAGFALPASQTPPASYIRPPPAPLPVPPGPAYPAAGRAAVPPLTGLSGRAYIPSPVPRHRTPPRTRTYGPAAVVALAILGAALIVGGGAMYVTVVGPPAPPSDSLPIVPEVAPTVPPATSLPAPRTRGGSTVVPSPPVRAPLPHPVPDTRPVPQVPADPAAPPVKKTPAPVAEPAAPTAPPTVEPSPPPPVVSTDPPVVDPPPVSAPPPSCDPVVGCVGDSAPAPAE